MSTDLVPVEPETTSTFGMLAPAAQLADTIARTEFVPGGLRGKPDAIAACVLFGHELGIPPMASLSKIHVIDGRPAMAAELMRAVVMREGHEVWFEETTTTRVTVCARRKEWPADRVVRVTWTMDDAKKAGLDSRQNWRKYPRAMLKARASSEICRDTFPDVLGGISYSIEELDDGDFEPDEVPAGETPAPATQTRKAPARTASARKAPAKREAPTPPTAEDEPPLPGDDGYDEAPPVKDTATRRSQMLVIKAREAGLDEDQRHALVEHVTGGRTSSTKDVTSADTDLLVQALDRIAAGESTLDDELDTVDAVIVDDEPEPAPEPDPAPAPATELGPPATADLWATALKARRIRTAEVLRWANQDAAEINQPAPATLAELAESPELADLVWIRVVDRDEP